MTRRSLPAVLALGAASADLAGAHAVALAALLAAIPLAFVLVLDCYGDAVAARSGGGRSLRAAVGLALLVFSAALRSPAVVGGVPRLAVTAVFLALAAMTSAMVTVRPVRAVRRTRVEPEELREAA